MGQDLWWDKGTSTGFFWGFTSQKDGFPAICSFANPQKTLDVAGKFSLISVYIWHVQRLLEEYPRDVGISPTTNGIHIWIHLACATTLREYWRGLRMPNGCLVLKLGNPLDSPAYLHGSWICPFGKVSEASKIERKTPWPFVIRTLTALMRSFLWGPTWGPTGCFREPNETPRKWGMIPPKHGRSERDFWQFDVNRIW